MAFAIGGAGGRGHPLDYIWTRFASELHLAT